MPGLSADCSRRFDINTLTCRVDRGGPVLVSFFGAMGLGQVAPRERAQELRLYYLKTT
jgi:hypothetical protein